MTTAIDIITRSLRTIGVLGVGETADADQAADGLVWLNDLIESWSNEELLIFDETVDSLVLTGATTYTVGTGGTFNISRPTQIYSAYCRYNNIDTPVSVLTKDEWDALPSKSTTGSNYVQYIYLEPSYPLATLYVYPIGSGATLYIRSWKPLTTCAALTTTLSFPVGYEAAFRECLADAMQSVNGKNRPKVTADAMRLKAGLKRANHRPSVLISNFYRSKYARGNILTGY